MMYEGDLISRAEMLEALGHFNDYVNGDPHFLSGISVSALHLYRCRRCGKTRKCWI